MGLLASNNLIAPFFLSAILESFALAISLTLP
jgi:hypothetical protein